MTKTSKSEIWGKHTTGKQQENVYRKLANLLCQDYEDLV